jgi:hypothetical protein
MPAFLTLAFLAILIACTFFAVWTWYARREAMESAEKQLFTRFLIGLGIFWLVAAFGYFGGFISFSR